jgi:hypothetical protein
MGSETIGFLGKIIVLIGHLSNIGHIVKTRWTEKFDWSSHIKGLELIYKGSDTSRRQRHFLVVCGKEARMGATQWSAIFFRTHLQIMSRYGRVCICHECLVSLPATGSVSPRRHIL